MTLAWGLINQGQPEWLSSYAPRTPQGRLFIVSGGQIKFPTRNFTVGPLSGISAWGFVKDTAFVVELETGHLVSADSILFRCLQRHTIIAKDEDSLRRIIVEHTDLYAQLHNIVRAPLLQVGARHTFSELKFSRSPDPDLQAAVERAIEADSPYRVRESAFAMTAHDVAVDRALEEEITAPAVARASQAPWSAKQEQTLQIQGAEKERLLHELELRALAEEHARKMRRLEKQDDLEGERARREQDLYFKVKLIEAIPNIHDRLPPALFAELETARIGGYKDVARAEGVIRAVEMLLGQPLLPERKEHTFKGLPFTDEASDVDE